MSVELRDWVCPNCLHENRTVILVCANCSRVYSKAIIDKLAKLTQYEAVLVPVWELLKEAEETLDDRGLPYIFPGTVEKLKEGLSALEDAGE